MKSAGGARALLLLDRVREGHLTDRQHARLPNDLIEEKFGWLDDDRDVLRQWEHVSLTGRQVISEVRRHGYGSNTVSPLKTTVSPLKTSVESASETSSRQLVRQLIDDVHLICDASSRHGRLPGSSEVLESLFGKGKRLLSGTSLGQVVVDQKSNEITAIPQLLKLLEIQGALVTIDAIGRQTAIADQIIAGVGHYCLAVKMNQPISVCSRMNQPIRLELRTSVCRPAGTMNTLPNSCSGKDLTRNRTDHCASTRSRHAITLQHGRCAAVRAPNGANGRSKVRSESEQKNAQVPVVYGLERGDATDDESAP